MSKMITRCQNGSLHLVKVPKQWESAIVLEITAAIKQSFHVFEYNRIPEIVVFSSIKEVVIPEMGITGNAKHGDIVVDIDFSRTDINTIVHKRLPGTIYHEFSHVVRMEAVGGHGNTLLDAFVSEGVGSYVEEKMSDYIIPWIQTIKNEQQLWQKAKQMLNKKEYDYFEWFFGMGKIPRWAGYRLGYLLVSSFMSNTSNISMAKLIRAKARDVLRGSEMSH